MRPLAARPLVLSIAVALPLAIAASLGACSSSDDDERRSDSMGTDPVEASTTPIPEPEPAEGGVARPDRPPAEALERVRDPTFGIDRDVDGFDGGALVPPTIAFE